jgi:hypothetical protein
MPLWILLFVYYIVNNPSQEKLSPPTYIWIQPNLT